MQALWETQFDSYFRSIASSQTVKDLLHFSEENYTLQDESKEIMSEK